MSAEILREAANELREQWGAGIGLGTAWHQERAFHLAVADWLDNVASGWAWEADEIGDLWGYDLDGDSLKFEDSQDSLALTVARAYLGRDA